MFGWPIKTGCNKHLDFCLSRQWINTSLGHTQACTHTCTCTHTHSHTHTLMHACMHTHTHTHTHTQSYLPVTTSQRRDPACAGLYWAACRLSPSLPHAHRGHHVWSTLCEMPLVDPPEPVAPTLPSVVSQPFWIPWQQHPCTQIISGLLSSSFFIIILFGKIPSVNRKVVWQIALDTGKRKS